MKKLLVCLLMICACTATNAQQLTVKSVNLRPQDARARTNPRDDAKGQKCAIIRVGVVGVENLIFPDAVGNVERSLSEYVVYVPDGLKSLKYKSKSGEELGSIIFDDYGLNINSLASYDVIFESTDRLRSAIFSIQPTNATLVFDGKIVEVNSDGIAMINKPVGEYSYMIMADGYLGQGGTVTLLEDNISTVTDIVLEQQLYPVTIKVFPEESTVFIDDVPYTKEILSDLMLPEGKHKLRVTAANYQDEERTIKVTASNPTEYFALKEAKHEIVKHKEERSRIRANVRTSVYPIFGIEGELYDKNKYDAHSWAIKWHVLSFMQHFGGIFGLREGISLGWMHLDKEKYNEKYKESVSDSSSTSFFIEVPLQTGFSIPFGKGNKHLISLLGGAYGKVYFLPLKEEKDFSKEEIKEIKWDYGLRFTAQLDVFKCSFAIELSNSLNGLGMFYGVRFSPKF